MRILVVHNRYQLHGGEDTVFDSEVALLAQMGHEITTVIFDNASISQRNKMLVGIESVWSRHAEARIAEVIKQTQPHLMHVHNFFPLASPSIYSAARKVGVRVIQTLHNFRLLCLSGDLFRDGQPCKRCLSWPVPIPGVRHACYRDDAAASLACASMLSIHRARRTWHRDVDLFLALGEFSRQKFIDGGLPAERMMVKPNFLMADPGPGEGNGGYLLYAGRLSEAKGVRIMLDAWRGVTNSNRRLRIFGEGPLAPVVMEAAAADPTIEFHGQGTAEQVGDAMGKATALIFPSIGYETQGMSMVEALARGTPVIAFDVGGRSEMISVGESGWLVAPVKERLVAAIGLAIESETEPERMRHSARAVYLERFTSAQNGKLFQAAFARLGLLQ